jgi:hypothetical protein
MASNDLQAALDEYSSAASPYNALDDYLMQRPVFDRGPRAAPAAPTMRTLESAMPDPSDTAAARYGATLQELRDQDAASETARREEISALRDLLREELASSGDAARAERSELSKSLEDRIDSLRRGIDAETIDLRQAGLDERAALTKQIEEGDRLVSEAQTAAIGSLEDRQGSLVSDLKERIGSLSADLDQINGAIEGNYTQLDERQQQSADATQVEIDDLNQQLEDLYAEVDSGVTEGNDLLRGEVTELVQGLESAIGDIRNNISNLPIEEIQKQLAGVNDQTEQFQGAIDAASAERQDLASQIEALRSAGVSEADLQNITAQRQTDISAAIDPLQAEIDALRDATPGEVDVDALRESILAEVRGEATQTTAPSAFESSYIDWLDSKPPPMTRKPSGGRQGLLYKKEKEQYDKDMAAWQARKPSRETVSTPAPTTPAPTTPATTTPTPAPGEPSPTMPDTSSAPIAMEIPRDDEGNVFGTPEYGGNRGINPPVGRRPDGSIITLADTSDPVDYELAYGEPPPDYSNLPTQPDPINQPVFDYPVPDPFPSRRPKLPSVRPEKPGRGFADGPARNRFPRSPVDRADPFMPPEFKFGDYR